MRARLLADVLGRGLTTCPCRGCLAPGFQLLNKRRDHTVQVSDDGKVCNSVYRRIRILVYRDYQFRRLHARKVLYCA